MGRKTMPRYTCPFCGAVFAHNVYYGHYAVCKKAKEREEARKGK